MTSPIRLLAMTVALLVSSLFLAGCGALDELDAANAMMKGEDPKKVAEVEADPVEAPKRLEWENVTSIEKGELDSSFVQCKLGSNKMFMKRDECLTRGGRPEGI